LYESELRSAFNSASRFTVITGAEILSAGRVRESRSDEYFMIALL
jgi:hypothetical protein